MSIGLWLSEVCNCVPLEKITYSLKGRGELFDKIWKPFLDYIKTVPHDLIKLIYFFCFILCSV